MTTAIQVKERSILFSGPMVRALLARIKTQTRRAVKVSLSELDAIEQGATIAAHDGSFYVLRPGQQPHPALRLPCPYGQPGDRLWVRETWRIAAWREKEAKLCADYAATPDVTSTPWIHFDREVFDRYHRQTCDELTAKGVLPDASGKYEWPRGQAPTRWCPSIHMPRAASRLLLEITAVRCERLQSISEADAVAEGIEPVLCATTATGNVPARKWKNYEGRAYCDGMNLNHASESYRTLWQSINGPDSWEANVWVWVVEFKVIAVN